MCLVCNQQPKKGSAKTKFGQKRCAVKIDQNARRGRRRHNANFRKDIFQHGSNTFCPNKVCLPLKVVPVWKFSHNQSFLGNKKPNLKSVSFLVSNQNEQIGEDKKLKTFCGESLNPVNFLWRFIFVIKNQGSRFAATLKIWS